MTDISFIVWLQQFSNSFLDIFFTIVTKIGNPEYYMIVVPLFYWCINKRDAFKFTMFFLFSMYINSALKAITSVARPSGEEIRILYNESTYGSSSFPSGHTQGSASFWGYMSLYFKNRFFTILAVIIIILVGISRMYLGLHYPVDVIGGLVISILLLIIFNLGYDLLVIKLNKLQPSTKMLLSIFLPLILLSIPAHDKGMLIGFFIGLLIGYQFENEYVKFKTTTTILKQVIKFVIGIIGFVGLRIALKQLFITLGLSELTILGSDVLRYFIIGVWASLIAPYLFVRLGLAEAEREKVKSNLNYIN